MTASGQALKHGIGSTLRAERQRRRISLDAVSRGTLVRFDFLELIDEDRFHELPAGAYAKGFIRSYASFLGLDPKPFVKSYEERYAQPAPELSRVVRRGVRVPPAAQKRAWAIAISTAIVVILMLALLGAFRSGEDPARAPAVAATAARASVSTAPSTSGAIVQVMVTADETWVSAEADGETIYGATLKRGETRTFKGADRIVLFIARARNVAILANGRDLGTPDVDSYRGVFTPSTTALPAHEPKAPAVPAARSDSAEVTTPETQP